MNCYDCGKPLKGLHVNWPLIVNGVSLKQCLRCYAAYFLPQTANDPPLQEDLHEN